MQGEIRRPPSPKQIRQTASSGTSRATPAACVEAAVAEGCAEEGGGAAEEAAVDDDRAAGEAAVVEGAECALAAAVVAPALTDGRLTAVRFPSGPLAARMTTTGQSMTPSEASDASSSCRRLPSWQTWKSPAELGRSGRRRIRRRSSPRVAVASSRVTVSGLPPSLRAASITRQVLVRSKGLHCIVRLFLPRRRAGWVACAEVHGDSEGTSLRKPSFSRKRRTPCRTPRAGMARARRVRPLCS